MEPPKIPDIKKQIESYKNLLATLKDDTESYNVALEQTAKLQNQLNDINDDIATSTADLGKSFEYGTDVLKSIQAGFTAAQGVMNLFGADTKELQNVFVKFQAAISITQSITTFCNGIKAANLAMKAFNNTLLTNPIFLVVTALAAAALIASTFVKSINENEAALERLEERSKTTDQSIKNINVTLNSQIDATEAWYLQQLRILNESNADKEEYDELERKRAESIQNDQIEANNKEIEVREEHHQEALKELDEFNDRNQEKIDKHLKTIEKLKSGYQSSDVKRFIKSEEAKIRKIQESQKVFVDKVDEAEEKLKDAYRKDIKFATDKEKAITASNQAAAEAAKKSAAEAAQARKKQEMADQQAANEAEQLRLKEEALAEVTKRLEQTKEDADKAAQKASLNTEARIELMKKEISEHDSLITKLEADIKITADVEKRTKLTLELIEAENKKIALNSELLASEKNLKDEKEKLEKEKEKYEEELLIKKAFKEGATLEEIEDQKQKAVEAEIARLWKLSEDTELTYAERTAALQKYNSMVAAEDEKRAKKEKENAEKLAKAKIDITTSYLDSAAKLLGEETAAGKIAAVASATISTYQAANSAYASMAGIPVVGPALGVAAAGAAVAAGIVNVKKILKTDTPGSSDSTSSASVDTSTPSLPSFPEITDPINETYTSIKGADEDFFNQMPQAVLVVEDLSSVQNRVHIAETNSNF